MPPDRHKNVIDLRVSVRCLSMSEMLLFSALDAHDSGVGECSLKGAMCFIGHIFISFITLVERAAQRLTNGKSGACPRTGTAVHLLLYCTR